MTDRSSKKRSRQQQHQDQGEESHPHKKQKMSQEAEESTTKETSKKSKKKKKEKHVQSQEDQYKQEEVKQKKKKKKSKKRQEEENREEEPSPKEKVEKKSKNKKHNKQVQPQEQPSQQPSQIQQLPKKKPKKKKQKVHQEPQGKPEKVKHQQQQEPQQNKSKKSNKSLPKLKQSLPKKKIEKVESINVLNRQLAKQCVTKKSNFYLQKQQKLKQGLPVGRGSKKAQQKIEQQRKRLLNQRNKKKKNLKKQTSEPSVKEQDEQLQPRPPKAIVIKKKKDECTKEQSIRIINLFSVDAGDYRGMVKQLPDIPLSKIRGHLRMLFQRCLQIITKRVQQSGRKINDWQLMQKREIVRELHRIRCTNRLLSQQNVDFREKFLKLMMNYNDPTLTLTDADCNYLYRKIQAFVRGFCSLGTTKKKNQVKFEDTLEENRQPLLQGGYIMDRNRVKRQVKIQEKLQQNQLKKIDTQKIIMQWTEQEEKELGKLYILHQANTQSIHEQLKIKFGLKSKWKDFELLNRKIDHLVKMGLYKLQQLTLKPYKREERMREQQQRQKIPVKQSDPTNKTEINSLDLMTKFIYNNKRVVVSKGQQNPEGGLLKNLPLLERQIFGHVESIKSRFALVKLLSDKFPPQNDVEEAIRVIKQFVGYAGEWQKKNKILLMRQEPVLQDQIDIPTLATRLVDKEKPSEEDSEDDDSDQFGENVKGKGNKLRNQVEGGTNYEFQFPSDDENIQELMNEALQD